MARLKGGLMHRWGDEGVDWQGLSDAAKFIAVNLRRWGRISVMDYKEKFGTVRVYCSLGWYQFHCLVYPGYAYNQWPKWLWKLDCMYGSKVMSLLNYLIVPYHEWLYKEVYKLAVNKWPHLSEEITSAADYPELLREICLDLEESGEKI
jgi:hypothetical protein